VWLLKQHSEQEVQERETVHRDALTFAGRRKTRSRSNTTSVRKCNKREDKYAYNSKRKRVSDLERATDTETEYAGKDKRAIQ
jgi:hypothetical protein